MRDRFGRVLRAPYVPWLLGASFVGRLPFGILGLAIVLFVYERTGSFASAGAVSAAYGFAAAIGSPVQGRLIDRAGQTRVIVSAAAIAATGGAALIGLGLAGAPVGVLWLPAVVLGLANPQLSAALRGLWPDLLGDSPEAVRTALALDAIVLETVFIGGPLLAGVLVAVASPAAALVAGVALAAAGALAFASSPPSRAWHGTLTERSLLGPLVAPGMRTLLLAALPLGFALGTLEVALPAFGVAEGDPSLGGYVIAAMSVGSVVAGVAYGARAPARILRAYLILVAALPLGVALLALPWSPLSMLLLAPLAGATLAPLTAAENEVIGHVAPPGTLTEAYTWIITATVFGISLGVAVAGAIVDAADWRAAIVAGAALSVAGCVAAIARRDTLVPQT